jgi:hypothetical protein
MQTEACIPTALLAVSQQELNCGVVFNPVSGEAPWLICWL